MWHEQVMARTLYGEARGETPSGKVAVAAVILNRVWDKRWPNTVAEVCLQPLQFSCWNPRDPNRARIIAATDEEIATCMQVVVTTKDNEFPDPTNGANHYLTKRIASLSPPVWFDDSCVTLAVGNHLFLRL